MFTCGGHVGLGTGTIGIADAGGKVDAALFILLVEHELWDIWEKQPLLLDDILGKLPAAFDLLDAMLVEGELFKLACGVSCLSSSSSSSTPLMLTWVWVKDCLDVWREDVTKSLPHDGSTDVVRVQDEVSGHTKASLRTIRVCYTGTNCLNLSW